MWLSWGKYTGSLLSHWEHLKQTVNLTHRVAWLELPVGELQTFQHSKTWLSLTLSYWWASFMKNRRVIVVPKKCTSNYSGDWTLFKWIYGQIINFFLRRQGQGLYPGHWLLIECLEIHIVIGIHWSKGTFKTFNL